MYKCTIKIFLHRLYSLPSDENVYYLFFRLNNNKYCYVITIVLFKLLVYLFITFLLNVFLSKNI